MIRIRKKRALPRMLTCDTGTTSLAGQKEPVGSSAHAGNSLVPMSTIDDVIALAASHGLQLSAGGASVNEAGLDYRVVMADDTTGRRWVLRVPRREDVSEGMAAEARILDLVAP